MKIKMKSLAASEYGVLQPGKEYEVTEDAGKAFINGGYAELVAGEEVSAPVEEPAKEEGKKGKK